MRSSSACAMLSAKLNAGVIQSNLGQYTIKHFDTYDRLVRRTGRPSVGQTVVHRTTRPTDGNSSSTRSRQRFATGIFRICERNTMPNFRHFTLKNTQAFDEFETWKNLMFMEEEPRKRAFADPQIRRQLRDDLNDRRADKFSPAVGYCNGRESCQAGEP